ncbi:MAG: 6-phosphofructo-2-kinase/fructose-2,6-bisphosphatase [Myxococcota bacterium]
MHTLAHDTALVLVMVGLPARGKTFMARKIARYLNWLGVTSRVFNVGNYRRHYLGSAQPATFFDPKNPEGFDKRRQMAMAALDDLLTWLKDQAGRAVAIYDATNVTRQRRQWLRQQLANHGIEPVFVESMSSDRGLIEHNIRQTKLSMPDYANVEPEEAVRDFRERIAHYQSAYEPVDVDEGPHVKVIDVGERVNLHRIHGSLLSRIVFFLMNLHIVPRPVFLTRHGESDFNVQGRLGGDPDLTARGRSFARDLAQFFTQRLAEPPIVFTSTLKRARQTAEALPFEVNSIKNLDEIDAGVCDGWTYADMMERLPEEYASRQADKLRYRYPRGESYEDVIQRLDPVIIEVERQRSPVIIVAHQAVIRCLYGYLTDQALETSPHLAVPLHTVTELVPRAYGAGESRTSFIVPDRPLG